jgi:hypothetical protein
VNIKSIANGISQLETLGKYQRSELVRKLRELIGTYEALTKLCNCMAEELEKDDTTKMVGLAKKAADR